MVNSVMFPESLRLIPVLPCCFALLDHFDWNGALNFVALNGVGPSSPSVQLGNRGEWGDYVDIHVDMGDKHHPSMVRPFLQRCHARIVSAWLSCGCC